MRFEGLSHDELSMACRTEVGFDCDGELIVERGPGTVVDWEVCRYKSIYSYTGYRVFVGACAVHARKNLYVVFKWNDGESKFTPHSLAENEQDAKDAMKSLANDVSKEHERGKGFEGWLIQEIENTAKTIGEKGGMSDTFGEFHDSHERTRLRSRLKTLEDVRDALRERHRMS